MGVETDQCEALTRRRLDLRRVGATVARLAFVWLLCAAPARAGDVNHDGGGWLMFFGQGSMSALHPELDRFRWWLDVQPRFTHDSDFDQILVRPGVGYSFGDLSLWLGYLYVHTDPASGASFGEHRIWQQLLYVGTWNDLGWQSRTRLEQRFVDSGSDTGWRFREFVKLTHPLGFHRMGVAAYDEIFVDLNDTDWGADGGIAQNRLFLGLSWRPVDESRLTIELGYLNQYVNNGGRADTMNHIASLNFLYSGP